MSNAKKIYVAVSTEHAGDVTLFSAKKNAEDYVRQMKAYYHQNWEIQSLKVNREPVNMVPF